MSQEEKISKILTCVEGMQKDVADVKRAVYGDEVNKWPGLLDRQSKGEKDIASLKEGRKKLLWIVTGFGAAVEVVYIIVKEML